MITKPTIYTEEVVLDKMNRMYDKLLEDESILFVQELFKFVDFNKQRYSECQEKYSYNPEVKLIADSIKEILETRCAKWAISGKYNATFAIFNLKNNYWWKDKTEVENTHKVEGISKITLE